MSQVFGQGGDIAKQFLVELDELQSLLVRAAAADRAEVDETGSELHEGSALRGELQPRHVAQAEVDHTLQARLAYLEFDVSLHLH